jgi:hypothetical protein
VDPNRAGKIVLTAWGIDGVRVVERGPIVGWQWSSCDDGPIPVTVMFRHDGDEHLGWAVLLPDGRVTAPENRLRDKRGRFVSMYAWRYWCDEAAWAGTPLATVSRWEIERAAGRDLPNRGTETRGYPYDPRDSSRA